MNKLYLNSERSWKSAADIIVEISDDTAEVSYDSRQYEALRLPTVEIRLDDPARFVYGRNGLNKSKVLSNVWWDKEIVLSGGYSDIIYQAFAEMIRVINALGIEPQLAWSSIPLLPFVTDNTEFLHKQNIIYQYGAVHTIWVRDTDDNIKNRLSRLDACGLVQVQNMATANTWIRGQLQNRVVAEAFIQETS